MEPTHRLRYLPLCAHHLPDFSISHIGFSTSYSRQFLPTPYVSFNTLQKTLFVWPYGDRFIRDAHMLRRSVVTWTVNEDDMMRWSINHGLDGVITDDPKRFREVSEDWVAGNRAVKVTLRQWMSIIWLWCMVAIFGGIFRWRMRAKKGDSYIARRAVGRVEEEEVQGNGSKQVKTVPMAVTGREGLASDVITQE